MINKTRVLVLVQHFGQGGAEKLASLVAEMLRDDGHFEVFFCSIYRSDAAHPMPAGVSVHSLDIKPTRGLATRATGYVQRVVRLARLKAKLRIDVTISSLWPADWANALTGSERKVAVVVINIVNNPQNALMVRLRGLVSYIYGRFDRVIVGSASLAPEMTAYFGVPATRLTVIPNSIDTASIDRNLAVPLPASIGRLFEKYRILIVANRLNAIKNTRSLIPVFGNVKQREQIKLAIVGDGEEEGNVRNQAAKHGLRCTRAGEPGFDEGADIYFFGFQTNIHNLIQKSRLFLLGSRGEGLPLTLLEALYCGTPVLASDCPNGGVFEAMQGQETYDPNRRRTAPERTAAGFLMPIPEIDQPDTIDAWSRCVSEMLEADAASLTKVAESGRAIARGYDRGRVQAKWVEAIDSV